MKKEIKKHNLDELGTEAQEDNNMKEQETVLAVTQTAGLAKFDQMEAEQENAFKVQSLSISIDHKNQKFVFQEQTTEEISAVILWADINRGLWMPNTGKWSAFDFTLPICHSATEVTPEGKRLVGGVEGIPIDIASLKAMEGNKQIADELEPIVGLIKETGCICSRCIFAQWGSALEGTESRGQACKETRSILLWWQPLTVPVTLRIPTTSLRRWDQYCSGLESREIKKNHIYTKFSLEKDQKGSMIYSRIKLTKGDKITADDVSFLTQPVNGGTMMLYDKLVAEFKRLKVTKSDEEPGNAEEKVPF